MKRRWKLIEFILNRRGAALVEFTLAMPFLLILAAGLTEFGVALHQQHVVTKSVRDSARYAARVQFATASCPLSAQPEWGSLVSNAQVIAMRGNINASSPLLLPNWTQTSTVTVTHSCVAPGTLSSPAGVGNNIPVITVSASVPFVGTGFLAVLGLPNFNIQATHSQMWVGL